MDVWINNAGVSQRPKASLRDTADSSISSIINTNVLGYLWGCKNALQIMVAGGTIFNVDGAGTSGMLTPMFASYGFSKAGLLQLMGTLNKENEACNNGIIIHTVSPGMVMTDLLLSDVQTKSALTIFNILAENPDTVSEWLVPRMRACCTTSSEKRVQQQRTTRGGQHICYLTMPSVLFRFLTSSFRRNRLVNVDTFEFRQYEARAFE